MSDNVVFRNAVELKTAIGEKARLGKGNMFGISVEQSPRNTVLIATQLVAKITDPKTPAIIYTDIPEDVNVRLTMRKEQAIIVTDMGDLKKEVVRIAEEEKIIPTVLLACCDRPNLITYNEEVGDNVFTFLAVPGKHPNGLGLGSNLYLTEYFMAYLRGERYLLWRNSTGASGVIIDF
ncbi:hypothetical protein PP187_gp036 [Klebsiella phage vB_KvM-Eowyn]|uniref:Uncharacterized protein n=1 Tax=Klebsiella phage vB_KvM-Eowyn TaxID=2762819 RepID=A0A7R8R516_9CAUD|nr:hypothetical protein PP187_gp036 [Klebsiella phage vB_KvM-Eowyn]CAD5236025.1 hypothetical protein LLCLJKAH_00036 [Klebsiella phage vB_KvM-Eowyn]